MFIDEKSPGEATRVEPSIKGFLAFARTRPPEEPYTYTNDLVCACSAYAASIGHSKEWHSRTGDPVQYWMRLDQIAFDSPRTYGALAEQLAYLARTGD
jgi:hypothetical protein